jgi:23S rRNA (guanine2445-N2)-methyltransferase / 23S rRNA (guanine2069-N7)-methyltransferase
MTSTFDVQRDHVGLIRETAKLLDRDGVLIFSNNLRRFRMDTAALRGLEIEDITSRTIPRDFVRNQRVHNCWRIRLRPGARGTPSSGHCALEPAGNVP